jgi:hypothetical protein
VIRVPRSTAAQIGSESSCSLARGIPQTTRESVVACNTFERNCYAKDLVQSRAIACLRTN